MTPAPTIFLGAARASTFIRDRNNLRAAIRDHDTDRIEAAWDKFERWTDCIDPNGGAA